MEGTIFAGTEGYLTMKVDAIIAIHILVDDILLRFDRAGISPNIDELDDFSKLEGVHLDLATDLKLALESINKEIKSLEQAGYTLKSLSKGTVTWQDHDMIYEWSLYDNKTSSKALAATS